jgi:hypothetical protein
MLLGEFNTHFATKRENLNRQYDQTTGGVFYSASDVGAWLKKNTTIQDEILVWGNEPEIYYYANKVAPTKYINLYGLIYEDDQYSKWLASFDPKDIDWLITYRTPIDFISPPLAYLADHPEFKEYKILGDFIIFKNTK